MIGDGSRLVFVGGKGGVGKTTTAGALALSLADKSPDHKIMIISTDPAHSLSDSFQQDIGSEATPIQMGFGQKQEAGNRKQETGDHASCFVPHASNLYAQELDAGFLLDKFKSENEAEIKLLAERGTYFDSNDIQSFFRLSLPGIDEVMSILEIDRLLKEEDLKHLIVDTAPTGHTLSLLRMPELLETWLDVFELLQEKHHILQRHFSGRVIKDNVDDFIENLRSGIRNIRDIIRDGEKSQFIVVMLPEMLSLFESKRLIGTLRGQGIPLHSLVLNGVQNGGDCAVCNVVHKRQEKVMSLLEGHFPDLNIIQVPLAAHSIQGIPGLEWFATYLESSCIMRRASCVSDTEMRNTQYDIRNAKKTSLSKLMKGGPKLFIVGGKGGVGKTTVSSTTAIMIAASEPSKRYLLFSIDPAHSLFDCLKQEAGSRRQEAGGKRQEIVHRASCLGPLASNLYAYELDAGSLLDNFKKEYADTVDSLFNNFFKDSSLSSGMDFAHDRKVVKALIEMSPPGLDELMALYKVIQLVKGMGKYDAIIFDTAPSGHLFRFLEMPRLVREWLKAIFQLLIKYKQAVSLGPAAEKLVGLSKDIREIIEMMQDEKLCRTIVVSTPEAMVVSETRRFIQNLERLKVPLSLLIINMLRENIKCDYCREIRCGQNDMLGELKKIGPKEWISIPYLAEDIRGIEKLKELGKTIYSV